MHDNDVVLIVDDEPAIRTVIARMLSAAGIENETAGTMREAEERVKRGVLPGDPTRIALAVIDLRLSDGNGLELISRLRGIDRSLKYVIVTGYPADANQHPDVEVVGKPFDPVGRDLVLKVEAALEQRCLRMQSDDMHSMMADVHKMLKDHIDKCAQTDLSELLANYIARRRRDPLVWGLVLLVGWGLFALSAEWAERGTALRTLQRKAP